MCINTIHFAHRYPKFTGKVSLFCHSLGSVITFDLLWNQRQAKAAAAAAGKNSQKSACYQIYCGNDCRADFWEFWAARFSIQPEPPLPQMKIVKKQLNSYFDLMVNCVQQANFWEFLYLPTLTSKPLPLLLLPQPQRPLMPLPQPQRPLLPLPQPQRLLMCLQVEFWKVSSLRDLLHEMTVVLLLRISTCHSNRWRCCCCVCMCVCYVAFGYDMTHVWHTATHCNTLRHTATHCNTLQHMCVCYVAFGCDMTTCDTLQHTATQHTATHCNTLQHTATHCNTLQHTATHVCALFCIRVWHDSRVTHCNTLRHTATHCNTLQHPATHCNTCVCAMLHLDVTWLTCDTTQCGDNFVHTTYSDVWHDSFLCVTWLVWLCDTWIRI